MWRFRRIWGIFNPFKEQLSRIQDGFKKAVAQEVKSERTKSELITNVSHDLKTPLTAIITYVNLLKQENVTAEERKSYVRVLDQKSMRLKALIEDLFEVSKASSGTGQPSPGGRGYREPFKAGAV
ncbi:MAG: sensor histidine kinase [Acutalibacteraceae bacterium]